MNFPTLETLEQRNLAQIKTQFPDLESEGKGILEVMARMHASAMHLDLWYDRLPCAAIVSTNGHGQVFGQFTHMAAFAAHGS